MIPISSQRRLCCVLCHVIKRQTHNNNSVVTLGNVSPILSVQEHIKKPIYTIKKWHFLTQKDTSPKSPEIKTEEQIKAMRESCKLTAEMLCYAGDMVKPGITTDEIDRRVHEKIVSRNAYPSPLQYKGFPKSICTSVNNVICHGIPDDRELLSGDIINIDISVFYNGFHGDCAATFSVGSISSDDQWLCEVTEQCRDLAIVACGPQMPCSIVGKTISEHAREWGFNIVSEFSGHGIGSYFHGPPLISHLENSSRDIMKPGMTFTIEPILCAGDSAIQILSDGWTAVTKDNSQGAMYEHTILITDNGAEILTML